MSSDRGAAGTHAEGLQTRISGGHLTVDGDGRVRYVDERLAELFDSDWMAGDPLSDVSQALASALEPYIDQCTDGTPVEFGEYLDSGDLWLEGAIHPVDDGVAISVAVGDRSDHHDQYAARRQTALERLNDVASDAMLSREEKIEEMLAVGTDVLGAEYGFLTHIHDGIQEIEQYVGDHSELERGGTMPLSETYCQHTLAADGTLSAPDAAGAGLDDEDAYDQLGFECYLGVTLRVDGDEYGTVCFADSEVRDRGFDEHEQTLAELITDWIHHLLEQRAYERELEQQQAFTESVMNSLPDPLYAFDKNDSTIRWNDRFETVTGYSPSDIRSMQPGDFVVEDDRDRVTDAIRAVYDGGNLSIEATLKTSDDETIPYELSGAPLRDESGEIIGMTGVGRDITEQRAHLERLSQILETTRSLMQARDRNHVGELAANAASELVPETHSVFRLYDAEAGTLDPIATTDGAEQVIGDSRTCAVGEGYPGEVFSSGEPQIVDDLGSAYGEARSGMFYPVGVHGTIAVLSTEPDAFDETDEHVFALLATSAAAACMRAKRMNEVREAREQTERLLERVNGLVENTVEVLVQATTRDELEAGVVDQLAAAEPYAFAWIGQPDVTTETLVPTAWSGAESLSVEGRSFDLQHGSGPVNEAYRDQSIQVLTDLDGDVRGPWIDTVADSEMESLVAIPLVYKDATYGVLTVCARDPDVFDEREQVVLDALGRAVANAINAVERGRILDATEIIELEFAVDDRDLLFSRLAAGSGGRLESAGTDYRSDGSVRLYLSAEDVDPPELMELARQDPEVSSVTCVVEHDRECLLELVVEESLLTMLTEYGAVPRDVVAENGTTRFTVELPYEAEARELFELVEDRYPGTELLGYHERERAVETRQEFRAALSERLTDRQETALRTAYLGGFFDWPREVDGNELADAMDISRPTYHQHLRTAQGKVFEELFD